MRFTVEPWSAEYGPSSEAAMLEAAQPPKLDVEFPVEGPARPVVQVVRGEVEPSVPPPGT